MNRTAQSGNPFQKAAGGICNLPLAVRYLIAVVLFAVALALKLFFRNALGHPVPFLLFTLCNVLSAFFGGFGPGLLATALTATAAALFFLGPVAHSQASPAIAQLAVFVLEGIAISSVMWYVHRARDAAVNAFHRQQEAERAAAAAASKEAQTLEILSRLGPQLASERDTKVLVQSATDMATSLTGAAMGAFFYNVVNDRGESFLLYALSGIGPQAFATFPMPQNTQLFGPIFRGEAPVRLDDLTQDPRYGKSGPFFGMPPGHPPVKSFLALPVRLRDGQVVGGMFFAHPEPGRFSPAAEQLAVGIAAQTGVGLENARLVEALRKSEERFRDLAEAMPQIVWAANEQGDIDYFNGRWYQYTGVAAGLTGMARFLDAIDPNQRNDFMAQWRRALQAKTPLETEFLLRNGKTGEYRWFLGRAIPLGAVDGAITHWYGTATDIHEHKQIMHERAALLEAERAARTAAEQANRTKDEFLSTLSHELRTPLNAILGWAQILGREPGHSDDLREAIAVIERNARVQSQIIEDLLDMSRIMAGKIHLQMQDVDMVELLQSALQTVTPAATVKGLRVQTRLPQDRALVSGDPNRLHQVIWNLLSNAIKFTPEGGIVTAQVAVAAGHVSIMVSDTGQGISPEFLPHVFERFRQQDSSSRRRLGGLGLGLAIVRQIVELHGGTVEAQSAGEGQGTTFTVLLPARKPETAARTCPADDTIAPEYKAPDLAGVDALVVDDQADARGMLRRLLESASATVRTADSARTGLEEFTRRRPDILISDISMPGEDGYQLIQRVRELERGDPARTPAVALTAFARPEDRRLALRSGYHMHVSKPVDPLELLAVVAGLTGAGAAGNREPTR